MSEWVDSDEASGVFYDPPYGRIELANAQQQTTTQKMRGRPVTEVEKEAAWTRLLHSMFNRQPRARASVPVRADDDDVLMGDWMREQEATIAQQQARIEDDGRLLNGIRAQRDKLIDDRNALEQALAAERERAEKAETERDEWKLCAEDARALDDQLQAEREKSAEYRRLAELRPEEAELQERVERLEALAGLATEMADVLDPDKPMKGWTFMHDWKARYDALTTQAPEAGQ